jgi:hypothetical protein
MIVGSPAFAPAVPGEEAEFEPLAAAAGAGRSVAASFGDWGPSRSRENRLKLDAREGMRLVHPPDWPAGDDFAAAFTARLEGSAELVLDLRAADEARRRIVFGDLAWSGWVLPEARVHGGSARRIPRGRDVQVEVVVKGDLGEVRVDGKVAWRGHLGPARRGGMHVGTRNGAALFRALEVRSLAP